MRDLPSPTAIVVDEVFIRFVECHLDRDSRICVRACRKAMLAIALGLGIGMGLVLGKPIGILLFTWASVWVLPGHWMFPESTWKVWSTRCILFTKSATAASGRCPWVTGLSLSGWA